MSTMSVGPVILSLSEWTELNLTIIIQSNTAASALDSIESLLFNDALININGQTSSPAELAQQLCKSSQAAISFKGAVEVPRCSETSPRVFFTSIANLPKVVRDVPAQQKLTASIIVVIAGVEGHSGGAPDRKVKELNAVIHQGIAEA